MTYGLWLSAGGMQVNEYRQGIMANNLANTDTVGFKRNVALIHERQMESATDPANARFSNAMLDSLTGGPWTKPTYTSFKQGPLESTGRELDVAIEGDGFLVASDGDNTRYTRDGRMVLGLDGTLRLAAGDGRYAVLDSAGSPIVLDRSAGKITFGRNGAVEQDGETVAQLDLVDFADRTMLRKKGQSLFENTGNEETIAADAQVHGGFVEKSTSDAIHSMVDMIEVTRAYQLNARLVTLQDETIGAAVTRVGRIG